MKAISFRSPRMLGAACVLVALAIPGLAVGQSATYTGTWTVTPFGPAAIMGSFNVTINDVSNPTTRTLTVGLGGVVFGQPTPPLATLVLPGTLTLGTWTFTNAIAHPLLGTAMVMATDGTPGNITFGVTGIMQAIPIAQAFSITNGMGTITSTQAVNAGDMINVTFGIDQDDPFGAFPVANGVATATLSSAIPTLGWTGALLFGAVVLGGGVLLLRRG